MVIAILLLALVIWSTSGHKLVHEQVSVPEPIATPTVMIIPRESAAPRAVLVRMPPPRAELIRLPEWRIGDERLLTMPYRLEVLATYKGRLESETMLPVAGNAVGDAWAVGPNFWVWITQPGTSSAQWLDP
jgi:hypothetical protein